LTPIDDGGIGTGPSYGSCLYRSPSGRFYAFTTSKDGTSEQWELDGSGGRVRGTRVRTLAVGSQTEGCVADDEQRKLYVAEESTGVWAYGAEPDAGSTRTAVDDTGNLDPDLEGVTMYRTAGGRGYLIVSSQGADQFDVYDRVADAGGRHRFRGTFSLAGVGATDGIDVTSVDLGAPFSAGLFVAHDGTRPQAIALAAWSDIARALRLPSPEPPAEARPDGAAR
jgi:3-phytase